jgi:hypothetical protein
MTRENSACISANSSWPWLVETELENRLWRQQNPVPIVTRFMTEEWGILLERWRSQQRLERARWQRW